MHDFYKELLGSQCGRNQDEIALSERYQISGGDLLRLSLLIFNTQQFHFYGNEISLVFEE